MSAVVIVSNMRAIQLVRQRVVFAANRFAELVVWRGPQPLPGCEHSFKYRLAYVVDQVCVLRYDNEAGKGDHRHRDGSESVYRFVTPETLLVDFMRDIERWNDENGHT